MTDKLAQSKRISSRLSALNVLAFIGVVVVPSGYFAGVISIETVNMLGRYMAFAIMALGLDLIWGYTGILSLCQAFFFSLGGYAMGMYLAHHGGPEGIIDATGWKLPACLYVVYPYKVGEAPGDALVPWFWKPFYTLPATVLLALLIPGGAALLIGYFGFRSRVLRHFDSSHYSRVVARILHEQHEALRHQRPDALR
jgi:urea transport system permease protein